MYRILQGAGSVAGRLLAAAVGVLLAASAVGAQTTAGAKAGSVIAASSKLTSCILRLCCPNRRRGRMRGAIRFNRQTGQEQAQYDTQNHLLLLRQAVHARQYSGNPASPQWRIRQVKN